MIVRYRLTDRFCSWMRTVSSPSTSSTRSTIAAALQATRRKGNHTSTAACDLKSPQAPASHYNADTTSLLSPLVQADADSWLVNSAASATVLCAFILMDVLRRIDDPACRTSTPSSSPPSYF
jgi:hypothetical protein